MVKTIDPTHEGEGSRCGQNVCVFLTAQRCRETNHVPKYCETSNGHGRHAHMRRELAAILSSQVWGVNVCLQTKAWLT